MANEFGESLIRLSSDIDIIDFNSPTNTPSFRYIDNTLIVDAPTMNDVRFSSLGYSGRPLKEYNYQSRTISFDIEISGSTDNVLLSNVEKLRRVFSFATSSLYLAGGGYNSALAYSSSSFPISDTGDSGLMFTFRLGKDGGSGITKETGTTDSYTDNALSCRVLQADMIAIDSGISAARTKTNGVSSVKTRKYTIKLECEPYLYMRPRRIATISHPGLREGLVSPANSDINRIFITSGIIGSEPAPTRIVTQLAGATAIIMGRDAGVSMVNCPAYPVFSGSGRNDLYSTGDIRSATGKIYKIKITVTGAQDSFAYSTNNGSSYSANIPITPYVTYTIDTVSGRTADVYFATQTGHVVNDVWTFNSHQVVKDISVTHDVYANRNNAYSETGTLATSIIYNVPFGCHSRYKLYLKFSKTGFDPELSAKIYYGGYDIVKLYSGGMSTDWTVPATTNTNWVDVAIIDLTANAVSGFQHPVSAAEIKIEIYARSRTTISNPANITIQHAYLIPCPDENSWFHSGWTEDGDQYEHFCNYDMSNPYMIETLAPSVSGYRRIMPLNGTYGGDMLTLIPQIDNTIVMIPVEGGFSDWRKSSFLGTGYTGAVEISYKPRYLVI